MNRLLLALRRRRAATTHAFLLACSGLVSAQDSQTRPGGAPQPSVPQPSAQQSAAVRRITISARALDYSAMLFNSHGKQKDGQTPAPLVPVPLAESSVLVFARGLPGDPRKVPVRTDGAGGFVADLGDLPPGATVEFLAERKVGDKTGEKFYARSFEVGPAAPPAEVQFYRVAQSPAGIVQQVTQVVTMKDDKGGPSGRMVMVRQFIDVGNFGFEVWLGDVTQDKSVSYWMAIPDGFELLAGGISVDNHAIEATLEAMPHGGRGVAYRQPLFPAFGQDAHHFMTVLSRPYVEGESFDLGMHVEYPTELFSMNLQEGVFAYLADEGDGKVQLKDGGARPAMGQSQKITHAWMGEDIKAHATINGRVLAGKPPLDKAVMVVVACIAFVVVGGIAFGFLFGKRARPAEAPRDPVAAALQQLDDRKRRGEITSVDYAARRSLLLGPGGQRSATGSDPASVPASASAVDPAAPAAAESLLAQVEAIAARAAGGAEPRLAEDVRVLARAVRELLSNQGRGPAARG